MDVVEQVLLNTVGLTQELSTNPGHMFLPLGLSSTIIRQLARQERRPSRDQSAQHHASESNPRVHEAKCGGA
ncbi:hypothetical protein, partial [Micrococcus yunnanensis]|uniref:hypothetical protein n=1 Tax=Micrococcus yunnanensis TaxID=566027 RepID=UPI001ADD85B9